VSGPAPPEIGIITGLIAEATCLRRAGPSRPDQIPPLVFCAGASPERARDGAERLIAEGVRGLVSFGIAGGLDPALERGGIVLADTVITPGGCRIATHAGWRERALARAGKDYSVTVAPVAGTDAPVTSAADKRALFEASGAAAVDMESHAVAAAASAAGLPFLVLRAVADPAGRAVPDWALRGLGADGRARALPVLRKLVLSPWEVPALVRLGRDVGAALAALRRVAELGVPLLPPL
jgi:adenosylhomocysteine nucleosidase